MGGTGEGVFALFSGYFLSQIVCQSQQTGFYCHFFDTSEQKAFKMMIMLYVTKDRFCIKAALFPLLDPSFGFKSFVGLLF